MRPKSKHVVFTMILVILFIMLVCLQHKPKTTQTDRTEFTADIPYFEEKYVCPEFDINLRNMEMNKLPTEYHQQSKERVDIMVFGYARGGSTYVGEIIGHHEDAFYFYEPLWTEQVALKYYHKNYICEMNSLICRYDASLDKHGYIKKLRSVYKCDMEPLVNIYVVNWQRRKSGKSWKVPPKSFNKHAILQKRCNQSKVRVAKVLRITGDSVEEMIKINPKLKIVYLYRDPRGIVNSRLASRKRPDWISSMGSIKQIAEGICHKMSLDSEVLFRLKETYPRRIYIVSYETIAKYPEQSVRQMFGFLGLSISERYIDYISQMGKHTGKTDKEWNSAFRSNGFATSIKWQHEMSTVNKIKIDQSCVEVYKRLGYKSVNVNDLNNSPKNNTTS